MRFNDLTLGIIVAALGLAVIIAAGRFPDMAGMAYGPAFFPTLIGAGFCLCAVLLIISGLRARVGPAMARPAWFYDRLAVARAAAVLLAIAFYVLTSPLIGMLACVFIITLLLARLLGVGWLGSMALALALPPLLHGVFAVLLRVPLARGWLENSLF